MLVLISSGNDRDAGYHYRPLVAMAWFIDIRTDRPLVAETLTRIHSRDWDYGLKY